MELEFKLAECTTAYFKCIIKGEVAIFLSFKKKIKKQHAFLCKFQNALKGLSFHFQK